MRKTIMDATLNDIGQLVLNLAPTAAFRSMGDSGIILMIDTGQLYSCNETAEAFFRQLDGLRPLHAIAAQISGEFEVDGKRLVADIGELVAYLMAEGVLLQAKAHS